MFRDTVIGVRGILIILIAISLTIWTVYVGSRLYATYRLETRITQLEATSAAFQQAMTTKQIEQKEKLEFLERYVYEVLSAQGPIVIHRGDAAAWQKNRDEEIRRRLKALEEWRLDMGNR